MQSKQHIWRAKLDFADKQVFPKLDIVGWYATGEQIQDDDMAIHRKVCPSRFQSTFDGCSNQAYFEELQSASVLLQIMELNESPVFLLFHTQQNVMRKDLPVSLYESGKAKVSVELIDAKC